MCAVTTLINSRLNMNSINHIKEQHNKKRVSLFINTGQYVTPVVGGIAIV